MTLPTFDMNRLTPLLAGACLALSPLACGDDSSTDDGAQAGSAGDTSPSAATSNDDAATDDGDTDVATSAVGSGDSTDTNPSVDESSDTAPPELDDFSFFMTSLAGLQELSGNPQGFGGNLSYDGFIGREGADRICEVLAEMSMPGSATKEWRAFLSTSEGDAIDRIGEGPWYDRNGRLVAEDLAGLLQERPAGDPALADDLPNEWGVPNSAPEGEFLDNHDTMTASGPDGRLVLEANGMGPMGGGALSTCQDFTSAEPGQDPPAMGHSWPAMSGQSWVFVGRHGNGCEALVHLEQTGADCGGGSGVGCGGGYGGFYCFALNP